MHEDGLRGSRYGAKVHRVGQARRAPSAPRRGSLRTLRARPRQPPRPSCPPPHPCSAPLPCSALCTLSILCTPPAHPLLPLRRVTPLHPPHAARRTPHAARRTPHAGAPCPAQSHALVEFEAFASEHSEEEKLQEWVRRPACRPAYPACSPACPAHSLACPACSPRPSSRRCASSSCCHGRRRRPPAGGLACRRATRSSSSTRMAGGRCVGVRRSACNPMRPACTPICTCSAGGAALPYRR